MKERKMLIARRDRMDVTADLDAEAARIAGIIFVATPVEACGPDMPVAPARGAMVAFRPRGIAAGGQAAVDTGFVGAGEDRPRLAMRSADAFDHMLRRAVDAHEARVERLAREWRGPEGSFREPAFVPPVSSSQVAIGRHYRDLVERHSAGGMKCASMDGRRGGGGGEFMDAYLAEAREIAELVRRIGDGAAMSVRRVRPSGRGPHGARMITDRALVDAVCLAGVSLAEVLRRHGWSNDGKHRSALRTALAGALDRMQGYR